MAGELSLSIFLSFMKAGSQSISQNPTGAFDVAGANVASASQVIGTTDETLTFPADLATPGYCLFQNFDSTNFILLGNDGSNYPVKIKPGEIQCFRFNGTIHAKADTAPCRLGFTIIED